MARPIKPVDEKLVESLAAYNCSMSEIAATAGVDVRTLQRRYAAVIEKGRERGKTSLKKAMFDKAIKDGNVVMMIWLSKQMVGYTDKREDTITEYTKDGGDPMLRKIPSETLIKLIKKEEVG